MKWSPAWCGFIVEKDDARELEVFQCKPKQAIVFFHPHGAMLRPESVPTGIRRRGEEQISPVTPDQLRAWQEWVAETTFPPEMFMQEVQRHRFRKSLPAAAQRIIADMEVGKIERVSIVETPEVIEHFDPTAKRNRSDGERMQDLARAAALGVREPRLKKPPLSDKYLFERAAGVRDSDEARAELYAKQALLDAEWDARQAKYTAYANRLRQPDALVIAPMEGFRSSGVIFGAMSE